jgi:hypothetical protein
VTKHVTYVGSFDEVEIEVAPGRWAAVKHGASIEVGDDLAASLCDQDDNWQPKQAATKKPAKGEED